MRLFKYILAPLACALFVCCAVAQQAEPFPRASIRNTEVRHIRSSIVGDEFEIYIALPSNYHSSKMAYPVLYMTDANMFFGAMTQIARAMQQPGMDELPPFLLVGIGYRIDSLIQWARLLTRDLTPTSVPDPFPTGGAPKFLRFVNEELMPFIKKNFRTTNDAAFAGFSYGGLFGLYALFHEPTLFQRYIIGSPWVTHDSLVTFKYESKYASTHTDLPARVFMSVGGLEETEGKVTEAGIVTDIKLFADILQKRRYPNLYLKTQVFEGETHLSGIAATMSRGLRVIYGK
jgi:predicted alpha/beta superfamily hydrolase